MIDSGMPIFVSNMVPGRPPGKRDMSGNRRGASIGTGCGAATGSRSVARRPLAAASTRYSSTMADRTDSITV